MSVVVRITVKENDTGGVPIVGVAVELRSTSDAFIDRQFTNNDGTATFVVDPGSYNVYLVRLGVQTFFVRPILMTVPTSSTYSVEYYGVPFVPTTPIGSGYAIVYDYLYNVGLQTRPGIEVVAKITSPSRVYLAEGPILTGNMHTRTNRDGLFSFNLPRQVDLLTEDVRYLIEITSAGFSQEFAAADLDPGGAILLSSLST